MTHEGQIFFPKALSTINLETNSIVKMANTELEGCMADRAMVARTTPLAIESWTPTGSAPTCTPVLVTG